jgi:hypothetical protein
MVLRNKHPEPYASFAVGDEVHCLAWIGTRFKVIDVDDATKRIGIEGIGTSTPSLIDIYPQNLYMLTHEHWDQLWYWPDRLGETYTEVFDRFVDAHRDGEIVTGYYAPTVGLTLVTRDPRLAQAYRLDLGQVVSKRQITAQPVAAIVDRELVTAYDPSIPDSEWLRSGPALAVQIEMQAYRWALSVGGIILNVDDFDAVLRTAA